MTRNSAHGFDQDRAAIVAMLAEGKGNAPGEIDKFISRWPAESFGWMAKGVLFGRMGNAQSAMLMLRKALVLAPHEPVILNNMALLANTNGAAAWGGTFAGRALKANPSFAEAAVNLGISLATQDSFAEAEACYRHALRLRPEMAETWNNLSLLSYRQRRHKEAASLAAQAVVLNPGFAMAWNMLANAWNDMELREEAVDAYRRAMAVTPSASEAHSNLSGTLLDLRRTVMAEREGRIAVVLAPGYGRGLNSLGTALFEAGRLEEAVANQRRSASVDPRFGAATLNLAQAHLYLDDQPAAAAAYRWTLEADPSNSGLHAAIDLAVLSYLDEDMRACRTYLAHTRPAFDGGVLHKYVRVYHRYLTSLLDRSSPAGASAERRLHVVGESHALGVRGLNVRFDGEMMACSPEWIAGCKQWHLATAVPNRYKRKLAAIFSRLPPESAVVMMIGEIDCRMDDGILKAARRKGLAIESILPETVDGYVDFVVQAAVRHGHRITFAGVPCGNVPPGAEGEDRGAQADMIRLFNRRLQERAHLAGCGFIDLRAMTDRGDGMASGDLHIDGYHLLPTALADALENFRR